MNRTFIKSLQRATRIAVSLMLTAVVAVGCSDDGVDSSTGSFDPTGSGLTLDALNLDILGGSEGVTIEIDNEARTVNIRGLQQGSSIVGVDFVSNLEDAMFVPSLASKIGSWDKSFDAILCTSSVGATYTFTLPDYVRGDANTLNIDIDNPDSWLQEVGFMGADMERSGDNLIQWPNVQEGVKWAFTDCKVEWLRLSYDKKQELTEGVYNWAFYNNVIAGLDYIHATNPNVKLWATLKSDYNGYNNENNYPDWFSTYKDEDAGTTVELDEYAGFLARYLWYFWSKGHPIAVMSTSKEYTQCINGEQSVELIPMLIDSLNARGVPIPLFSDASTWSMSGGKSFVNQVVTAKGEDLYWGFCSHNYNSSGDTPYLTFTNAVAAIDDDANIFGEQHYAVHSEFNACVIGATNGAEVTELHNYRYQGKAEAFAQGLQGELNFEYWNDGTSGTRAIHCKRDGTDAYRMTNYFMMKSHINYFREKMNYLSASQNNMRAGIYTMQFADWGTNAEKAAMVGQSVKTSRTISTGQTMGPIYTENLDGQLYLCVVNESGSALSSFMLDLGNKAYNGAVEMHVMDNETVVTNGNKEGIYYYKSLEYGTLDITLPDDSVVFLKISLDESEGDFDDDDDDGGDSDDDASDSLVLEDLVSDGDAWVY
ncbi:MAG: hypothetical protein R3Y68_00655 [Rikenellaceae bacterium]